jgi:hypothetical protein
MVAPRLVSIHAIQVAQDLAQDLAQLAVKAPVLEAV